MITTATAAATATALAICPPDYVGTAAALAIASAFTLAALAVPRTRSALARLIGHSAGEASGATDKEAQR